MCTQWNVSRVEETHQIVRSDMQLCKKQDALKV